MDTPLLSGSIRLQIGSHRAVTGPVVGVDLSIASCNRRFEVSGLIGYFALVRFRAEGKISRRSEWATDGRLVLSVRIRGQIGFANSPARQQRPA
jgi:hypothetical protein